MSSIYSGRGFFITIEGGEGAGKSTCIAFIRDYLAEKKISAVFTREPGGTEIGEDVRGILLSHKYSAMSSDTELLLMFAARAEHISKVIKPGLNKKKWVISDRFTDATYAYQGAGRGISANRISKIEDWVQGELRPDITLLLDLPIGVGMGRAGKRGALDRFETEESTFFENVRKVYLKRAKEDPERFRIIDASQTIEDVQDEIKKVLDELVTNWF